MTLRTVNSRTSKSPLVTAHGNGVVSDTRHTVYPKNVCKYCTR